ncbi:pentatricopeptide repeat-containing protein At5g57250, mitochondrial-like [Papaver somniferum]|uniref:pentatricopeptide repeat-containing protein At5g57250, mitochondrial-like n=1 Tax=Papaver somniferum TaxID=3469 RepID=UPI000E700E7D|nr:pentatricopeptide repeat-containing protein At5g57250, mitochondrial-like [Papaver somniferum]
MGKVDHGFCLLGEILKRGYHPDTVTFTTLIKGVCLQGNIDFAIKMFDKMTKTGIQSVAITCNTIIHGLCTTGEEYVATQKRGGNVLTDLSELAEYLGETYRGCLNSLDILNYWKNHEQQYPVLSKMAGDILSIPISIVASESAFSIGGRVIDRFRSSLLPENVEALITTRDWEYGIGK